MIGICWLLLLTLMLEFVGLKNYSRVSGVKTLLRSFFHSPFWQTERLYLPWLLSGQRMPAVEKFFGVADNFYSILIFFVMGLYPDEGGRWYDRRFWPTVANTILFVALTVPSVTFVASFSGSLKS